MKKNVNNNLTSFASHLDSQYGKPGTASRDKYEEEFESFKLGVMLQEARKKRGLPKKLLLKCVEQQKTVFPE